MWRYQLNYPMQQERQPVSESNYTLREVNSATAKEYAYWRRGSVFTVLKALDWSNARLMQRRPGSRRRRAAEAADVVARVEGPSQ